MTHFDLKPLTDAQMNGNTCAVQGITAVATDPGYRRRGLLRKMMLQWMQRAQDEDIAYSLLWASLGAIYQRFGYGLGSTDVSYSANSKELTLAAERPAAGGHVSLVSPDDTDDSETLNATLRTIHHQFGAPRNLLLHRSVPAWRRLQRDTPTHCALYRAADGTPEGAVLYTCKWDGPHGPDAQQALRIVDFMWLNLDAYQALWQFLLSHDLVNKIDWFHAPEDDPLPLLLLEPRRLKKRVDDGTWLRIVSAQSGLQRRGYVTEGHVVMKLIGDELCPWNNGLWQIDTDGNTTEVKAAKSGTPPTVTLEPAALACLISGSVRATDLAHSGRLEPANSEALPQLDALFATRFRPWCPDHF